MWLVAGNRYLQCDGLGKIVTLYEVGGLALKGWVVGNCIKGLKRGGKTKIQNGREACWVKESVL